MHNGQGHLGDRFLHQHKGVLQFVDIGFFEIEKWS